MILSQRHLPEDDLALFALQLLEGDELEQALEHLEHCEDCRHEVARFQGDLVGYAFAMSELHSPPAQARERLLKKVAKEKKVIPVERVQPIERPAPVVMPVAERPQPVAERPLQQVAERLAERSAERSSERMPIAQPIIGDIDPRLESRSGIRAATATENRDPILASRGQRMFASVDGVYDDGETEERPRAGRGQLITMAAIGWAIAACMAVAVGLQYHERLNLQNDAATMSAKLDRANAKIEDTQLKFDTLVSPNAMQVSLGEPVGVNLPPAKPQGHVAYMADKGSLVFIADHLTPLPPSKTYELWLLQPNDAQGNAQPAIPAGLFKPDARGVATVVMPELPKGLAAHGFGVTMEDDGGAQKPTAPIVLVGF